jgi:hypothetical protein
MEQPPLKFKGEGALVNALKLFIEGKKPVIYFTQGHGEPELRDTRGNEGLGFLAEQLEKKNFELKTHKFGAVEAAPVPSDADVVVVAGPQQTLSPAAVKALEDYMNRKGKLVVLTSMILSPAKTAQPLGLEGLFARYSVELVNERTLGFVRTADGLQPVPQVYLSGDKRSGNPLGGEFSDPRRQLIGVEARPVRAAMNSPMGMGRSSAQTLLVRNPATRIITEKDTRLTMTQLLNRLVNNQREFEKRLEESADLSLAVAASDTPAMPHPGMPAPPGSEPIPRLVVIGSSYFGSNVVCNPQVPAVNADFLASSLDWVRGKSVGGGGGESIPTRDVPVLNVPPEVRESPYSFAFFPSLLILGGIVGTGASVWLVRRQ